MPDIALMGDQAETAYGLLLSHIRSGAPSKCALPSGPAQTADSGIIWARFNVETKGTRTFAYGLPGCVPSQASTALTFSWMVTKPRPLIMRSTALNAGFSTAASRPSRIWPSSYNRRRHNRRRSLARRHRHHRFIVRIAVDQDGVVSFINASLRSATTDFRLANHCRRVLVMTFVASALLSGRNRVIHL